MGQAPSTTPASSLPYPVTSLAVFSANTHPSGYTTYSVRVKSVDGVPDWVIQRRYSEFCALDRQINYECTLSRVPALPPKRSAGRFEPAFIEARRKALFLYLLEWLRLGAPHWSVAFNRFLNAYDPPFIDRPPPFPPLHYVNVMRLGNASVHAPAAAAHIGADLRQTPPVPARPTSPSVVHRTPPPRNEPPGNRASRTHSLPATSLADQEDFKTCVICFEGKKEALFLPCRHICCCMECVGSLKASGQDKCPVCCT
eukprot:CAMPEP_0177662898 /NCGR_PEP_ID=MMETSP0447-20121125/19597_1 /TAXON_ID=0 /ORGANISM="Stygamoeba regulata, Strain BSH-02190019" /LENGTH=255 /DNA_ID=CAMNT_0019168617 /DNA_START=336 /DNA_END=1099 /DNA_ORIENTATION=+